MISTSPVNRVVVVHGPADPMLTSVLDLVGLCVVDKIGDVTVWAPKHLEAPAGRDLPRSTPGWAR